MFNTGALNGGPPGSGNGRLSRRELEVARLVAEGLTNREISTRLFVSERTVDGHLEHVREKLGLNNRAQIAAWVARLDSGEAPPAPRPAVAPRGLSPGAVSRLRVWIAAALVLSVVAFGAISLFREPPPPVITTIAGTRPIDLTFAGGSFSGDEGPATGAELARPASIALGPGGLVYFADLGNHRVRMVAADATIHTVAGGTHKPLTNGVLAKSAWFSFPSAVAVDPSKRVYVLTNEDGDLQVWSVGPDSYLTYVTSLPPNHYQPSTFFPEPVGGLALAADGSMYISDTAADEIWRFRPGQGLTMIAGTGAPGFSGDGAAAKSAALDSPVGLALDEKRGSLYIADAGNDRIRIINLKALTISTFAGSGNTYGNSGDGGQATSAQLKIPFGVAVAPDGTVFIADTGNNRIRKVTPAGVILAVAGTGVSGFIGDGGPAGQAQLSGPEAVLVEPNGNLLIADTFNQRVRLVVFSR